MDPPPAASCSDWSRRVADLEVGPSLRRSCGWGHGECGLERGHGERDAGPNRAWMTRVPSNHASCRVCTISGQGRAVPGAAGARSAMSSWRARA